MGMCVWGEFVGGGNFFFKMSLVGFEKISRKRRGGLAILSVKQHQSHKSNISRDKELARNQDQQEETTSNRARRGSTTSRRMTRKNSTREDKE
jgi:hypothetical protein